MPLCYVNKRGDYAVALRRRKSKCDVFLDPSVRDMVSAREGQKCDVSSAFYVNGFLVRRCAVCMFLGTVDYPCFLLHEV